MFFSQGDNWSINFICSKPAYLIGDDPMGETFMICGRKMLLPDPPKTPALYKEYPGSKRKVQEVEEAEPVEEFDMEIAESEEEQKIEDPESEGVKTRKMKPVLKRKYTRKVKKKS
jgi:hypothetical protein